MLDESFFSQVLLFADIDNRQTWLMGSCGYLDRFMKYFMNKENKHEEICIPLYFILSIRHERPRKLWVDEGEAESRQGNQGLVWQVLFSLHKWDSIPPTYCVRLMGFFIFNWLWNGLLEKEVLYLTVKPNYYFWRGKKSNLLSQVKKNSGHSVT